MRTPTEGEWEAIAGLTATSAVYVLDLWNRFSPIYSLKRADDIEPGLGGLAIAIAVPLFLVLWLSASADRE